MNFIPDWKSNFVGNSIEDNDGKGLDEGMSANNYHLQYYIYTVAVKRYLERKLIRFSYEKNFSVVIYMFLRGIREKDGMKGVFFDSMILIR